MKLPFKKEPAEPTPLVAIPMTTFHVTQDMKLGINQQTGEPYYVLKLEHVTDLNGLQTILALLESDGSILVNVLDGKTKN